ncbi:MAG: methyltransferase domain-containing protein [Chloroflexi bacterium]|nr:methyltransferase domain-containing protein [Chloroflexota bacterium]
MTASRSVYESTRLADGYAFARPPVHPRVIAMIADHQSQRRSVRALDVGCGAGRSTDALVPLADVVVGIEPIYTMLTYCRAVAPNAQFAVAFAESLPFANRAFDLITAAGSLNYADLGRFLPDAVRILTPTGTLIIYDFSAGRRFRDDDALDKWFAEFERRYPFQPGYALDVRAMDFARCGLRLDAYHEFEIALPMSTDAYGRYVLSETNVERAIARGVPENEIRDWCSRTIAAIFGDAPREVLFTGYVAYVKPA